MKLKLPIKIHSEANKREHWRPKAARKKKQREAVQYLCPELVIFERYDGPITVTLTRIAPRNLDDDNLSSGFKAIRDEIAKLIGRDDNPKSGVDWRYDQRRGEPKEYACEIEIERADG